MLRLIAIFEVPEDRVRGGLSKFLKTMLRAYGLRCIDVREERQPKPILPKSGEALRMTG